MDRGAGRSTGRSTTRVVDMEDLKRARERRASSARHPSEQYQEERRESFRDTVRDRELLPDRGQPRANTRDRLKERPQPVEDDKPFWERESPFEQQDKPFWQQQDRPFHGMEEEDSEEPAPAARPRRAPRQKSAAEDADRNARPGRATGREPRYQERPQERKPSAHARERGGRAGLKALLILLALLTAMAVIGLKAFEIKAIDVKGAETMTPESVIALSGISRGENIFKVSLSQAKKNLESDPLVEVLGISRAFPDRIKIDIRQRKPHGALTWLGGYVIIDEKGFALDVRDSLPAGQYPLVTGVEIKPAERGKPVEGIAGETMKVMQGLLTALYDEKAAQYVSEINLADTNKLMLLTAEGLQIDMGKAADLPQKAKWVASSVPELRKQGYTSGILYVSGSNGPVYSAAGASAGDNGGTAVSESGDQGSDGTTVNEAGDSAGGDDANADNAGSGQQDGEGQGEDGGPENAA